MRRTRPALTWILATWILCAAAPAQTTRAISQGIGGAEADNASGAFVDVDATLYLIGSSISDDGRYVLFSSLADNLVPGDTNGAMDVFLRDSQSGAVARLSTDSTGVQGNDMSVYPSLSADGRYLAFASAASNLVANDTNASFDIFVKDLQTGSVTRASVDSNGIQANAYSSAPVISGNGRFVAFTSIATNLVTPSPPAVYHVYVRDLQANTTAIADLSSAGVAGNGGSSGLWPSLSADGRYLAFVSEATNLVPGDTNGRPDAFVRDLQTGTTTRIGQNSVTAMVAAGGRWAACEVYDGNFSSSQCYVHDLQAGTDTLVSIDFDGTPLAGYSYAPVLSPDGRYVAFSHDLSSTMTEVYVRDLQTGVTSAVSADPSYTQWGNGLSLPMWNVPCFSGDGRYLAYFSSASNLVAGDTNGKYDVFVRDLQALLNTRASVQGTDADGASQGPSFSDGARFVAFWSNGTNLVPGDTNSCADVFVRDLSTGAITRASVGPGGVEANAYSTSGRVSSDGRYVAFSSLASNLVPGDTNGAADVFVRDVIAGTTTRASVDASGAQAPSGATYPSMSSDGRYVAFESFDPLVPGDTNGMADIFVRDLVAGTTVRASVSSTGAQADVHSVWTSISADGRMVGFDSYATNLVPGDTNGLEDCFVRDLQTGTTTRVSVSTGGAEANDQSFGSTVSPDGRYVVFCSFATNLVPGDTNGMCDVFVRDLQTGTTTRESVGAGGVEAIHQSFYPSISRGGRYVTFASDAWNLVAGDTNGLRDVFLRDRLIGQTFRVSVSTAGAQSDGSSCISNAPTVSPDGRLVAFESFATNLVLDDANGQGDVFLRDRGDEAVFARFCFGDGSGAACPCGNTGSAGRGCQNSAGTGGAVLTGSGVPSLAADTVHLTSSGELSSVTSILLQGTTVVAPTLFGDGRRCAGGTLKRMYTHSAVGGVVTMPQGADLSISARSAALGSAISVGATCTYQVYYRDPSASFCPSPTGNLYNISSAVAIVWGI